MRVLIDERPTEMSAHPVGPGCRTEAESVEPASWRKGRSCLFLLLCQRSADVRVVVVGAQRAVDDVGQAAAWGSDRFSVGVSVIHAFL